MSTIPRATAKRRRRRTTHKAAPIRRRRRTTRRHKGLSEGLTAGINQSISPILMGIFGGIVGIISTAFMKNVSPLYRVGIGAILSGVSVSFLKAPNFAAGVMAGVAMPAVGQLLTGIMPEGKGGGMDEGYLMEDLPEIIDDGETLNAGYLNDNYLSAPSFLNDNYLSEELETDESDTFIY